MQSPPVPRYLVPPRSKYSPQHHILKHPQLLFLPQCQRTSWHCGRKWAKYEKVYRSSCKVIVILVLFNETWISWTVFRTVLVSNFMKIRPVGPSCCRRTDGRMNGQTDMTKLNDCFSQFCELPQTLRVWGSSLRDIMICTRGCNYSFMYSWWWTPETCIVI